MVEFRLNSIYSKGGILTNIQVGKRGENCLNSIGMPHHYSKGGILTC